MASLTNSWIAGSVVKLTNEVLWFAVCVGSAPINGCEPRCDERPSEVTDRSPRVPERFLRVPFGWPQRVACFHCDLRGDTSQTPKKSSEWRSKESGRTCELDVYRWPTLQYGEDSIEVTLSNCFEKRKGHYFGGERCRGEMGKDQDAK